MCSFGFTGFATMREEFALKIPTENPSAMIWNIPVEHLKAVFVALQKIRKLLEKFNSNYYCN